MNAGLQRGCAGAIPPAVLAILGGGLIAGALDITYAITVSGMRGVTAIAVLQSVASGVLGREAYRGGIGSAALGTFLHFFIACGAAAVYYVASSRIPILVRRAVPCGLAFGFAVFLTMKYLIVPLSAFPGPQAPVSWRIVGTLFAHLVLFGLPIALLTRRARSYPSST